MLFRFAGSHREGLATAVAALFSTICMFVWPAAATAAETVVVVGKKPPADPSLPRNTPNGGSRA
jgi:hypothetical protein